MIKTTKKITKVEFAKNSIGTIAVSSDKNYKLVLQQMKVDKKVGSNVEEKEYSKLPKVELEFHNAASIDVVIRHLQALKNRMQYPHGYPAYYLAC